MNLTLLPTEVRNCGSGAQRQDHHYTTQTVWRAPCQCRHAALSFHEFSKVNVHMSLVSPPTQSPFHHSDVLSYDLRAEAKMLFLKLGRDERFRQNITSPRQMPLLVAQILCHVLKAEGTFLSSFSLTCFMIFNGHSSNNASMAQQSPNTRLGI